MQYTYNQAELSDKTFGFIYGCAMQDAILQRSFNGEKNWVKKVAKAQAPLRSYIDHLLRNGFSSQPEHDDFFLKTADQICKTINAERPADAQDVFSFGNAQKLINIAAKHTYSFCYFAPALRENFRFCHCPLDSIMLAKVWKLYKEAKGADRRKDLLINGDYFFKSWGSEGQEKDVQPEIVDFPDRYLKYQTAIRQIIDDGDLFPLEFDYLVWKE